MSSTKIAVNFDVDREVSFGLMIGEYSSPAILFKLGEIGGLYESLLRYVKRYHATSTVYPFIDKIPFSDELETFIGAKGGKVAAVHIRTAQSSGNAGPSETGGYASALALLKDEGYSIVFIGREPMPQDWKHFGVVNYSQSRLASFENDFKIAKRADLAITGASGVSAFFIVLDKPCLMLNTKLMAIPAMGRRTIYTPALAIDKSTGRVHDFLESLLGCGKYGIDGYRPEQTYLQHPTEEEILVGVQEVMALAAAPDTPMTDLQTRYRQLEWHPAFIDAMGGLVVDGGYIHYACSRMSEGFLQRHQDLMVT